MEIFLIALGLSADAFAVSLSCGAIEKKLPIKFVVLSSFLFGTFQGVMPLLGFLFGGLWAKQFDMFGHWISFALLAFIGGKMIIDAVRDEEDGTPAKSFADIKNLLMLAVATSIDAFAVGVSFSFNPMHNILHSITIIALTTLIISFIGVFIGKRTGEILGDKAEILGGTLIVLIGIKILIDHYA